MQSQTIPNNLKISPYLVFYVMISMQIGIGILGYQRIIADYAGYDAWISILILGVYIHIVLWMMYKLCEMVNGDIITVHEFLFGRFISKVASFAFVLFYITYLLSFILNFIEVIQIWMFPDINNFAFSVLFLLLSIYIVYGGLRTVVGVCFFGTILPAYLVFTFTFTLKYADFTHLLPIWQHKITELLQASYHMSLTSVGFEAILFIYPFINQPQKSKKWAHIGVATTTIFYTILAIVAFAYFSKKQLENTIWATLSMWQMVQFPFVERFEYIGVANWCLILLPNICLSLWIASRLLKRATKLKQRKGSILISVISVIIVTFFEKGLDIERFNQVVEVMSVAFVFVYIPFLYCLSLIIKKVKKT
ncbi:GerAB/ArcD/ProY family transporter [Cytobacillus sp. FSL R5-0569]|uniref:GerAB/ArcD/ProY family transporter n=1 Tax=Cytobacillus TaxID=2675230 RepID=UPI002789D978|nr:GerAB/ArcD/ProY family transporter [Cytobacillus kochii]MDQ0187543.1 spore germination protein (amino acid permease) [Cytobacillus kochii]